MQIITKGFTEILAEKIASKTGGELFKLEPEIPYPNSYEECVKRSRIEDQYNEKVKYLHPLSSLDDYDVVKNSNGFVFFTIFLNSFFLS